jgi:hypothetical protein
MFFASLTGLIYPETAERNDRVLNDIEHTAERGQGLARYFWREFRCAQRTGRQRDW